MIQDEPTRWNSSFYMIRRIVEQKEAIILVNSKSNMKVTMKFVVSILEIFEQSTLQVSKTSSNISEVIPLINTVNSVVENIDFQGSGLLGVKNDLLPSLKRRYPDVEANLTFACATLLDPRFKTTPFKNANALEAAKTAIIREMVVFSQTDSASLHEPAGETTAISSDLSGDKVCKSLWSHYNELYGNRVEEVDNSVSSCETELFQYLGEKNLDPNCGEKVPHYWANSVFLKLRSVAIKYLCVPPCTVYSERLCSTAGNICDVKRNRLDPDRVKMLVFLNKNIE